MALQTGAEGEKINWINYKTGIKYLYFRMDADQRGGRISIDMNHPDPGIQELMFEQFQSYKAILAGELQEDWEWALHGTDQFGKCISSISKAITEVNIFKQEDWPSLITFFKPRIMALDSFWSDVKYGFELFR